MTDRDDAPRPADDAARAEVDALRALLAPVGLGASVAEAPDASDQRDEVAVAAALALILGAGPGQAADDVRATARADADASADASAGEGARAVRPGALAVGAPADAALADAALADAALADAAPAAAGAEVAPVVPLHRPGRTPARRRWWTVAAGAAAVAAVAVGYAVLPGTAPQSAYASGSPPMLAYPIEPARVAAGAGEDARSTLLALADAADAQVDPERAGDVQHLLSQNYWSSTVVGVGSDSGTTIDPVVSETWLSADGSAVSAEWRGAPLHEDGTLERLRATPDDAEISRSPAGTFDPGAVDALPTEPVALRAALLAPYADLGCGPDGDPAVAPWCLYLAVTGFADMWVLPSDVEAAVWRVLADEPGVTLAGTVVDRAGHEAVAVSVPASPADVDPTVRLLLVDRDTGRLSGREEITLSSPVMDIDEPTVTYFRYAVASAWVADVRVPGDGD